MCVIEASAVVSGRRQNKQMPNVQHAAARRQRVHLVRAVISSLLLIIKLGIYCLCFAASAAAAATVTASHSRSQSQQTLAPQKKKEKRRKKKENEKKEMEDKVVVLSDKEETRRMG